MKEIPEDAGLVNSDKTVRSELYSPELVRLESLQSAADNITTEKRKDDETATDFRISLSPATIKISRTSNAPQTTKTENYQSRQQIKKWSQKSRSSMIFRLATLDCSPLLQTDKPPIMVTLTYPKNWEILVPDAATAKRHLLSLKKRYERKFNEPFYALWKMEFQRRSAVHWHIFCNPTVRGREFRDWLSFAWSEIVNEQDPVDRAKHLQAGTGVDLALGFSAPDARRVSAYFSKHSSPATSPKEYQNKPPELWLSAGKSVGRFWGYWHLKPMQVDVSVSEDVAKFAARTLRRWHKANSKSRAVFVWRVNRKTGVLSKRKVNRRPKRFTGTSGYLVVKDGSEIGEWLAKAIRAKF